MDSAGVVSACCSSGGISLKHPGRVGQVITTDGHHSHNMTAYSLAPIESGCSIMHITF